MEKKSAERIGVLDLGTNTFNLLIANLNENRFEVIYNEKIPVKIGKGGIHKKVILPDAEERAIKALKAHRETLDQFGVRNFVAYATSAMRDADNGTEIQNRIFRETGIRVQIIDGNREAQLIFRGVQLATGNLNKPFVIMDIGGGSTEFIIVKNNAVQWMKSYPLGVSRLLEILQPNDPITEEDIHKLNQHLKHSLSDLTLAIEKFGPDTLIGSSGSFDTLVEMIGQQIYDRSFTDVNPYEFKTEDFDKIAQAIVKSTLQERLQMPGLVPMRAEMMVLSTLFIQWVLREFQMERMLQSNYALKEGVIAEYLEK